MSALPRFCLGDALALAQKALRTSVEVLFERRPSGALDIERLQSLRTATIAAQRGASIMSKSFTPKVGAKKTPTAHRKSTSEVSAKKAHPTHRKPTSQVAAEKVSNAHRKETPKVATETVRGTHHKVAAKIQE